MPQIRVCTSKAQLLSSTDLPDVFLHVDSRRLVHAEAEVRFIDLPCAFPHYNVLQIELTV
jgi:hypothetical protein